MVLETTAGIVAKSTGSYLFKKGLDSINKETFDSCLTQAINRTIDTFSEGYPAGATDGRTAFYGWQVFLEFLFEYDFFQQEDLDSKCDGIIQKLNAQQGVVPTDKTEIGTFIGILQNQIGNDEFLRHYFTFKVAVATKEDTSVIRLDVEEIKKAVTGRYIGTIPKDLTTIVKTRKEDIVGRREELQDLRKRLCDKGETALINGMGGIGKTTLAAVYVNEYYEDYDHIAWVTIENTLREAVSASYDLLTNLNLKDVPPENQLDACWNTLRSLAGDKPNLLVLDNAHDTLAQHYDALPKRPHWHLLVTSRERIGPFHIMDLDFLDVEKAVELFRKHGPDFDKSDVEKIVTDVERHTLTIEILAKSAKRNRWDLEYVRKALAYDAKSGAPTAHSKHEKIDLIKSYLASIFDTSNLSDNEIYILKQFTALPNQWVEYDFLSQLLQVDKLEWQEEFAGTLASLYDKGFVLNDDETDSYKMHPVLVEALAPRLEPSLEDLSLLVTSVASILHLDAATENPLDKFQYVPFGDAIVKQTLSGMTGELARLQSHLGLRYQDLGEYEKARDLLEAALQSDLTNFGEKHPTVAVSQSNLANVYRNLGEYEKARDLLEAALQSDLTNFGEKHPTVAVRQSNLALVYNELGEYEKARDLLEAALQSALTNFGEKHPHVAVRQSNLATVYIALGKRNEAVALWTKAYEICVKAFGDAHPHTKVVREFLDEYGG